MEGIGKLSYENTPMLQFFVLVRIFKKLAKFVCRFTPMLEAFLLDILIFNYFVKISKFVNFYKEISNKKTCNIFF